MHRLLERLNYNTFTPLKRFVSEKNENLILNFKRIVSENPDAFIDIADPIAPAINDILVCDVDRYGFKIDYVLNPRSGVIRARQYYSLEVLDIFYKNYYREIYMLGDYSYSKLFSDQILLGEKILKIILDKNIHVSSVLDVGTGVGGALLPFKSLKAEVEGIDLNLSSIKWGKENAAMNLSNKTLVNLKSERKKFDLIILNHVIEHIVNINEFMREVKDLLSTNGVIYISVPSLEVVTKWYNSDFGSYFQNAHIWNFSLRSFHLFLEQNGLFPVFINNNIDSLVSTRSCQPSVTLRKDMAYEKGLLDKTEKLYRLMNTSTKSFKNIFFIVIQKLSRYLKALKKRTIEGSIDEDIRNIKKYLKVDN